MVRTHPGKSSNDDIFLRMHFRYQSTNMTNKPDKSRYYSLDRQTTILSFGRVFSLQIRTRFFQSTSNDILSIYPLNSVLIAVMSWLQ